MSKEREIFWTKNAKEDLKEIYKYLKQHYSNETALKIRLEIFKSVDQIVFPEQFQVDEYRLDCRRIVVRNYKVLYQIVGNSILCS